MRRLFCAFLLGLVAASQSDPAVAQRSTCRIEPFQGATLAQGAVARMQVANNGVACAIINYGVPAERINPADSGAITRKASHGKTELVAPQAQYTPEPGYLGEDEFEFEAFAKGRAGQQLRLRVRVKVLVVAQ